MYYYYIDYLGMSNCFIYFLIENMFFAFLYDETSCLSTSFLCIFLGTCFLCVKFVILISNIKIVTGGDC